MRLCKNKYCCVIVCMSLSCWVCRGLLQLVLHNTQMYFSLLGLSGWEVPCRNSWWNVTMSALKEDQPQWSSEKVCKWACQRMVQWASDLMSECVRVSDVLMSELSNELQSVCCIFIHAYVLNKVIFILCLYVSRTYIFIYIYIYIYTHQVGVHQWRIA